MNELQERIAKALFEDWQKSDRELQLTWDVEGNIGGYSRGTTPSFECDFASASVHP